MKPSTLKRVGISLILILGMLPLLGYFLGVPKLIGTIILPILFFGIPLLLIFFSLKKIIILIFLNLFIALAFCLAQYDFGCRPNALSQLGGMFLFLCLIVMIIVDFIGVFLFWGKHGFLVFAPLVIPLLCFKAGSACLNFGHNRRLEVFEERLPQYEEVVHLMDSELKNERIFWGAEQIPRQYRHLAYRIYGERKRDVLRVVFFWGSGFPVKHSAFAYISNGALPAKGTDFRRDWPHATRINEHWFRVGD